MHELNTRRPTAAPIGVGSSPIPKKISFSKSLHIPQLSTGKDFLIRSRLSAITSASPTATKMAVCSPSRKGARRRSWDGETANCLPEAERPRLRRRFLLDADNRWIHRPFLDECPCHTVCCLALRISVRAWPCLDPRRLVLPLRALQMACLGVGAGKHGGHPNQTSVAPRRRHYCWWSVRIWRPLFSPQSGSHQVALEKH